MSNSNVPVAVMATRQPVAGHRDDFETVLRELSEVASTAEGQEGITVLRPQNETDPYQVMFRFATHADLQRWLTSDDRRRCLERMDSVTDGPASFDHLTGFEAFLDVPNAMARPPSKPRQAFAVWLVVWPLITLIDFVTGPIIGGLPLYLESLVITAIMVPVMVSVLLPFLTRHLQSWLVPHD